jgi:hypothetical protein
MRFEKYDFQRTYKHFLNEQKLKNYMINNRNNNSHKIPITCTLFHLKVQMKTTMKVYYKPSTHKQKHRLKTRNENDEFNLEKANTYLIET